MSCLLRHIVGKYEVITLPAVMYDRVLCVLSTMSCSHAAVIAWLVKLFSALRHTTLMAASLSHHSSDPSKRLSSPSAHTLRPFWKDHGPAITLPTKSCDTDTARPRGASLSSHILESGGGALIDLEYQAYQVPGRRNGPLKRRARVDHDQPERHCLRARRVHHMCRHNRPAIPGQKGLQDTGQ